MELILFSDATFYKRSSLDSPIKMINRDCEDEDVYVPQKMDKIATILNKYGTNLYPDEEKMKNCIEQLEKIQGNLNSEMLKHCMMES